MAQEGIATLPQAPGNQAVEPDVNLIKQSIGQHIPGAEQAYDQTMDQVSSQLNLPPDQLQQMLQILQYMLSHEQEYPQIRQKLISEGGVRPEDLPEQFDKGYLTTMLLMVQESLKRQGGASPMAQGPEAQGFSKGGLAAAARSLAAKGRGGDTILAHINPQEAMMLKAMGGSGTINPATGIMEFKGGVIGGIGKAFGAVGDAVKSVASSTVGKIVMTVALGMVIGPAAIAALGPIGGAMAAGALASGAVSLAGGSNLKDALRSAAIGGALAGIGAGAADFLPGATGGWLNTGITAATVGTGYGLATGQNIGQALKTGAVAGLTAGAVAGAQGATMNGPAPGNTAPVTDNSTPWSGDVNAGTVNAPTTPTTGEQAVNITQQGGAITPTGEGISSLQAPAMDPYAVQDMQVQARTGEGILSANGQPVQGPAPYAGDQQYMNQDMQAQARTGADIFKGGEQPVQAPTTKSLSDYYTQGKDYLFGTDPQNPGVFMNKDGSYSVPAVTAGVLGIGALTGGFSSSNQGYTPTGIGVDKNVTGESLVASNPSKYLVGNIPGYNAPQPSPAQANYVASPTYGMNRPLPFATYTPPPGAVGGQQGPIQQPYNTAAMYNFMPRMYAHGGVVNPATGIEGFKGGGMMAGSLRAIADRMEAEKAADTGPTQNAVFNANPDNYVVDKIPGVKRGSVRTGSTTKLAQGGISQVYPRRTGGISGPGTGTSDSIPAMLSDGEFVVTAKAVRGAGNGSRREGAKKLYRMMHALEKKAK